MDVWQQRKLEVIDVGIDPSERDQNDDNT